MIKRLPKRRYQRSDDPVLRLSRSAMKSVARDLRDAFDHLGSMVSIQAAIHDLRHGSDVKRFINWTHYREILKKPFGTITRLRHAGGDLAAKQITNSFKRKGRKIRYRKALTPLAQAKATKAMANYREGSSDSRCGFCIMFLPPDGCTAVLGEIKPQDTCDYFESARVKKAVDDFTFDVTDPKVAAAIRRAQDALISDLENDARDAIDTIISDGVMSGTSIEDVAANIRDMIGLNETQAKAALNYERMLRDLDPGALDRALRNGEYDAALQDAIDSGEDLSDVAIGNMVDDYVSNYLDYRAATIAQTESTRAANAGLRDGYLQAIQRGALPKDAVTMQWQLGDNPCPICEDIADEAEGGVGIDEGFDSELGNIPYPPVHPSCECSLDIVTDLTMLPDDGEEGDTEE